MSKDRHNCTCYLCGKDRRFQVDFTTDYNGGGLCLPCLRRVIQADEEAEKSGGFFLLDDVEPSRLPAPPPMIRSEDLKKILAETKHVYDNPDTCPTTLKAMTEVVDYIEEAVNAHIRKERK